MSVYESKPWLASYPSDLPETMRQEHANALSTWNAAVERFAARPCIYYFDQILTFEAVDRHADALASALLDDGLEPGDRVGILLQNDPQWEIVQLATWKAGGVVVALNPMLRASELEYQLRDAGVSVLVCLGSLYDTAKTAATDTAVRRTIVTQPGPWLGDDPTAWLSADDLRMPDDASVEVLEDLLDSFAGRQPPTPTITADDVAMLTYTSGTTGPSKGAMNTHGNVAYNAQMCRTWFSTTPEDVILGAAPLFHITGSVAHLGLSQASGAPVVLFHRFDPARALWAIERWGVTTAIAAITAYIAVIEHPDARTRDLSSLTKVASGGAPVSPSVVERFEKITGSYIHNVYGLTETTSPSHCTPLGVRAPVDPRSGALSVGLPVIGALVRVVDPTTREELPVDTIGELTIEGPMVVPGYWEQPEESEHAIPNGRLHTGDVGFMDKDGWFYIVDRAKDQINAAGYKVWPRDVEDVLYQHEAVREAAVVGLPDEYRGETVGAFVSLIAGQTVTPEELTEFCRERLAAYKYPRQIEILSELPKTPTGKILRRTLRDRQNTSQTDEPKEAK